MNEVALAGDWHGNTEWAVGVIEEAVSVGVKRILHLGDFGIWPGIGGTEYLDTVNDTLNRARVALWFVDGNHDDHRALARLPRNPNGYRDVRNRIKYLPRGYRWEWHRRTWLALGGAVSLDRAVRTEGRDWWPEEEITEWQAEQIVSEGRADVMLTHECPSRVVHSFPVPPTWWDQRDLARSDAHRERLQRVVNEVKPSWLFHGHLHRAYDRVTAMPHGNVRVVGLDCDGALAGNWILVDTESMRMRTPPT